jgi:hypothetical protein
MSEKMPLATKKLAKEIANKADNYGGGALVQSILNYLKDYGADMVEQEKDNIRKAFDAGFTAGMETYKQPFYPSDLYLKNKHDCD